MKTHPLFAAGLVLLHGRAPPRRLRAGPVRPRLNLQNEVCCTAPSCQFYTVRGAAGNYVDAVLDP